MEELINKMKIAFATSYAFYLKAHYYHWNVEGELFYNFHKFFGKIYEEVFDSLDITAEQIRALDAYVPGSFKRLEELSSIEGEERVGIAPKQMVSQLALDNTKVMASLTDAFKAAEAVGNVGLSDYLQGRLDAHAKHNWMLKATLK